jgi:outer membrane assembly lipoprotein YfiO
MTQRAITHSVTAFVLLLISLAFAAAQVSVRKVSANQTDTILFAQAQKALSASNFGEARTLLTNLIDTYPDSGYVPRAKLSIADSWYSERAFKHAEAEYRDFITFFPNRPEVAYAHRRINSIDRNTARQQRDDRDPCYSVMRVYHMERVDPGSEETRLAGISECQTSPIAVSYP